MNVPVSITYHDPRTPEQRNRPSFAQQIASAYQRKAEADAATLAVIRRNYDQVA